MGLARNWTTQVGLRVLLGAFESCFFPSALFLVSMWYVRAEVAKRNAFFYVSHDLHLRYLTLPRDKS